MSGRTPHSLSGGNLAPETSRMEGQSSTISPAPILCPEKPPGALPPSHELCSCPAAHPSASISPGGRQWSRGPRAQFLPSRATVLHLRLPIDQRCSTAPWAGRHGGAHGCSRCLAASLHVVPQHSCVSGCSAGQPDFMAAGTDRGWGLGELVGHGRVGCSMGWDKPLCWEKG